DTVNTGAGDDTVDGEAGLDRISGSTGDDDLSGGGGADKVSGGPGNDTLDGGAGSDTIAGSDGIDVLSGGPGADTMSGGAGDDGFDGGWLDAALPGSGAAACSEGSNISIACAYGAVIDSVEHSVEQTVGGYRVTVAAHVIDFNGVGATKFSLAEFSSTSPTHNADVTGNAVDGVYLSVAPVLASGTPRNGTYRGEFLVPRVPASGLIGLRVFTPGFSIDAYSVCGNNFCDARWPQTSWPCISTMQGQDAECGVNSGLGTSVAGFPKRFTSIRLIGNAAPEPLLISAPTLPATGPISPPQVVGGGLSGWTLVPTQTEGTDRAFVVFTSLPNCSDLGPGAFVFRINAFTVTADGWFRWSDGSKWSKTCKGTPGLTVGFSGVGTGKVLSDPNRAYGQIDCEGDAINSWSGTCDLAVPEGQLVTLRAIASSGSTFLGWTTPECSGTEPCQVSMDRARTVVAEFGGTPHSLTLAVHKTGPGAGTILSSTVGIDCGSVCSTALASVVKVRLTASAAPGSVFQGWIGGGCIGYGPCDIYQDGIVEVSAHFGTSISPTSLDASGYHACALGGDGVVKCWGLYALNAGYVQPTDQASLGGNLYTIDLGEGRRAIQLSGGYDSACALLDNGSVKCWGSNIAGQLGLGDTSYRGDDLAELGDDLPAVDLGSAHQAVQIATGANHSCALLDDGEVKCWGANGGKLGIGDTANRGDDPGEMGDNLPPVDLGTGRSAVKIAVGGDNSCAILDDATLKCWGVNDSGQLGQGDTATRGDALGEMGDALPSIDVGSGRTVTDLGIGWSGHICALLDNATVKCWGEGWAGVLGLGGERDRGDDPGEMGDDLPEVNLGTGRSVRQLAVGDVHNCAILDNWTVKCWGLNEAGQLGLGDSLDRGDGPGEMGDLLPVVDLGDSRTPVRIVAGEGPTCVLFDDHAVKCWGAFVLGSQWLDARLVGMDYWVGDGPGEMGEALPVMPI
ncbi:MAG: InlB B-repeat-containing protein, partial [Actinomycetes bacterium]